MNATLCSRVSGALARPQGLASKYRQVLEISRTAHCRTVSQARLRPESNSQQGQRHGQTAGELPNGSHRGRHRRSLCLVMASGHGGGRQLLRPCCVNSPGWFTLSQEKKIYSFGFCQPIAKMMGAPPRAKVASPSQWQKLLLLLWSHL